MFTATVTSGACSRQVAAARGTRLEVVPPHEWALLPRDLLADLERACLGLPEGSTEHNREQKGEYGQHRDQRTGERPRVD